MNINPTRWNIDPTRWLDSRLNKDDPFGFIFWGVNLGLLLGFLLVRGFGIFLPGKIYLFSPSINIGISEISWVLKFFVIVFQIILIAVFSIIGGSIGIQAASCLFGGGKAEFERFGDKLDPREHSLIRTSLNFIREYMFGGIFSVLFLYVMNIILLPDKAGRLLFLCLAMISVIIGGIIGNLLYLRLINLRKA